MYLPRLALTHSSILHLFSCFSPGPASQWELRLLHIDRSQEPLGLWREMGQVGEELAGASAGGGGQGFGGSGELCTGQTTCTLRGQHSLLIPKRRLTPASRQRLHPESVLPWDEQQDAKGSRCSRKNTGSGVVPLLSEYFLSSYYVSGALLGNAAVKVGS